MKKVLVTIVLSLLLVIATACESSDPVKDDLTSYANDHLIGFHTDMDEISALYASVRGDNYTDDLTMFNMIYNEILPRHDAFLNTLEEVTPETTEVSDIHSLLKEAMMMEFNAFLLLLDGLDTGDESLVTEANDQFSLAQQTADQFEMEILVLATEYDLEFK